MKNKIRNVKDRGKGVKRYEGAHKNKDVLGTLDSAEDLGDSFFLGMFWTRFLCLCRMTVMKPLVQIVSTKNTTSGTAISAAHTEPVSFS